MPILVRDVNGGILESIARTGIAKVDDELRKLLEKVGSLIKIDQQKDGFPGFPDLNEISPETEASLRELKKYCEKKYNM